MDPVKDLTLSKDSEVSGTPASNHKHHSWQWCGREKKSPWSSSTHSLWCFCSEFTAQRKRYCFKKKSGLTFSNHNHMTLNSKLKKKNTAQSQENTTFCSEKLREEASDNDNMKQVWKIMAACEENTSKKFRLPLPKMEEAFCQRLQTVVTSSERL